MQNAARQLFDAFLADRDSPNPLGQRKPRVGRRIHDLADIDPIDLRASVLVIEPWGHVGKRPNDDSDVIASENIAYIVDQILGVPTLIVPAWRTGVGNPRRFAALASNAMLIAFEGGEPNVHEAESFTAAYPRRAATRSLVELMLMGVPFVGICLSHQLAAQAHVELIREVVQRFATSESPPFVSVARAIREVGDKLPVKKAYGTVASSWNDETFAVAENEQGSYANTRLHPYKQDSLDHVPTMVSDAHRLVSNEYDAIIDAALRHENEIHIQTFHGNEVSEESMRFVCWAYQRIQATLKAYSTEAASNRELQALLGLPLGVEILASTHDEDGKPLCEVAATGTYWERGRTAITTQFHPELDHSLLTTSEGWAPSWENMKRSDGIRLLVRMLRACLN
jgi:GMP synthase-like glutamine amidotransferase